MKINTNTLLLVSSLCIFATRAGAQTSGMIWIKAFAPGSASLNDPQVDQKALAQLDSLMQDSTIAATFLGAADDLRWKMSGTQVHFDISEAWNDAKRLGRARILRARYGRGAVGVTDENIAGVKVIWSKDETGNMLAAMENSSASADDDLRQRVDDLRTDVDSVKAALESGRFTTIIEKKSVNLNWRLHAGMWSWYAGTDRSIVTPAVGINIIYNQKALVLQGGVSPWPSRTAFGKQGEAFLYGGIRHLPANSRRGIGYAAGVFRGWEYFTSTDSWTMKSTGLTAGPLLMYSLLEVHPAVSYTYIDSLFKGHGWRLGSVLMIAVNLN